MSRVLSALDAPSPGGDWSRYSREAHRVGTQHTRVFWDSAERLLSGHLVGQTEHVLWCDLHVLRPVVGSSPRVTQMSPSVGRQPPSVTFPCWPKKQRRRVCWGRAQQVFLGPDTLAGGSQSIRASPTDAWGEGHSEQVRGVRTQTHGALLGSAPSEVFALETACSQTGSGLFLPAAFTDGFVGTT